MGRIEKYIINRVIDASNIEDVVGDFVDLKKKGIRYVGCCPFHDDRHAGSFVVYPRKQCFKCFVCGAKGGVVEFLMKHERLSYPDAIRWLGKKYNIETDMTDFNYTPPPPRPKPEPLKMLVLPMSMVKAREHLDENNLVQWLRNSVSFDSVQRSRLEDVLKAYHVGHSKQGFTIFWQIDEEQQVRTGKMMLYYPPGHEKFGHRDKTDGKYTFDWIHASLSRRWDAEKHEMVCEPPYPHPDLYDPDKQEMMQCLFGLHLLNTYKRKDIGQTVCIVESEKTAIIMAAAYGNNAKQVWMACGGLENLNADKLKPIIDQGRHIILYPDRDGIDKWREKAATIGYNKITIDCRPVQQWWKECDGPKADIADVVVRMLSESHPISTIEEAKAAMPLAVPIIDKLNLEIAT